MIMDDEMKWKKKYVWAHTRGEAVKWAYTHADAHTNIHASYKTEHGLQ